MQIEQLPRCLLYRPVFGGGFGAPMGMVDTVTDRIAVGKQKKELLKMVNTGNETIDAQLKNYVDMVNQTATDLEDLVSAGRVNAQPSQSSNLQTTANIAPENRSGVVSGANDEIDVGDGNYQPFRYEVLDASTLSPTQQKDDNQFRDRDRIASQSQINNIARNLDPRKLASSPTMDIGAPLLALDGNTIIAGNGRTMAIRQAYQEDGADGYRQFLRDNADRFGIPPEQLDSVRNPVLVRRLTSPVDIAQVAINSNEQGGMRMSDLEQAKVDARRLPSMDSFIVGENGDINSLDNQSFVRQFILNQPENLRNELLDSKGNLSQTGVQRVRNAILYQAYGDSQVLSRLIENTDQGAKNVLNALVSLAPKVAQTQQDINVGTLSDVGISNDIIQAVEKYNQLNAQGYKISDYLTQNDFVGDLSPEAREILTIFDENRRSGKRIAQVLNAYFDQAQTQGNVSQANMFGDVVFDKLGSLQQAKTVDEDIRLSLNESADSDFAKAVVAISQGKNPESSVVQLGTTPDVLKMLGVSNANVVMGVRTLRKDMLNKHGVSAEAMKQLPAQMNNPVAVMRSQSNSSNPEAYLVLTELVEIENGKRKPIIAALSFEKNQKGDLELINVASAYGRRTNQINRDLANVLYWNKAKGEQLINNFSLLETAETASLRTLLSSATRLFDSNIKTETGLSQYQSAKNQPSSIDTQRFKQILTKAVGESAVKNIDIIQSGNKPDGVQQLITADVEGWFDPRTNKITLVADGIRAAPTMTREQRIAWVAWHELAHRGVNIRLKGEYKSIMHRADSHPLINAIANEIQQDRRGKQDKAAESRHVAVEEALAETFAAYQTGNFNELANRYGVDMSEQGFKAWLRQFADKVRALIDKLFGRETADKFSDTDLVNLMSEIKAGIHGESAVGNKDVLFSTQNKSDSFKATEGEYGGEQSYNQAKANGETELDYHQWVQVRTPEFKAWFGDWENDPDNASKVVNERTGEPLVVYHGTRSTEPFYTFKVNPYDPKIFFTNDKKLGNAYQYNTVGTTFGTFLNMRSPSVVDAKGSFYGSFLDKQDGGYTSTDGFASKARGEGYDGAIINNVQDAPTAGFEERVADVYVVFNSNQIKSATDNNGNFSSENDDIRFSRVQLRSKSESLEKLRQSETIRISGTEIEPSEDFRRYRRNAMEYGKTLRGSYINEDTGREISLGRAGVTEVLHHDISNPEHLQSVAAIPEIIKNSIYIDTLPNEDLAKNPDIKEYEYYVAGLNIGGADYTVRASVGIATTGDKYYDHKLTKIEKGDILEMTSRLSSAEISNQSPLSKIDDKRLLQILQDGKIENSNYRFSRSQSALDLSISGKAKKEQGFWGDVKSRNFESLKKRFNQLAGKIDENFADSLRPVNDWIDQMQFSEHTGKFNGRDHEKRRLKDAMYTAKGIRDALNSELEQGYLKPILNEITTITKKQRQDEKEIKALVST